MAITPQHDQLRIPTPLGHEIVARIEDGQVVEPKVVNKYTGVMLPLGEQGALALANARQAKTIGQLTLLEADCIQHTLDGFGALAKALGNDNPAISPYLEQQRITAKTAMEMLAQAEMFVSNATRIADSTVAASE